MNVIITGARGGLGVELAKSFREGGHTVVLLSHQTPNAQQETNQECEFHFVMDYANPESLIDQLRNAKAPLLFDVLVNNAALLEKADLANTTSSLLLSQFTINCVQPFLLTQTLLENNLLSKGAHVINVGSMAGYQGAQKGFGLGAYSASKGALAILTECMATEWANQISVNCLCLGSLNTAMFKEAFPDQEPLNEPGVAAKLIVQFALLGGSLMNGRIIPMSFIGKL